jgi:hypothetical protein
VPVPSITVAPFKIISPVAKTTTTIAKGFPLPDRKIDEATAGLETSFANLLRSIIEDNAATIVKYVAATKCEVNISAHYRRDDSGIIQVLQV